MYRTWEGEGRDRGGEGGRGRDRGIKRERGWGRGREEGGRGREGEGGSTIFRNSITPETFYLIHIFF